MKTFVECRCMGEMLVVEDVTEEQSVNLAFWQHGHCRDGRTPLREKWRLIKPILKTGCPYGDMVILNKEEVYKLIAALQQARNALEK